MASGDQIGNIGSSSLPTLNSDECQNNLVPECGSSTHLQPVKWPEKKRKEIESRSIVWQHFTKVKDADGIVIKAKCAYCGKLYNSRSNTNGTSTLRSHLLSCLKHPQSKSMRQQLLTLQPAEKHLVDAGNEGLAKLGTWKFSQEDVRQALAYMLIVDELPFKFVEGLGFKKLMNTACPLFKVPSRWTITRDCYQLYLEEKGKLKDLIKNHSQRLSLTTDTWSSIQRINYMCVTAHWIDDEWNLQKRILSFVPISGHRGEYIAKSLENCLLEWEIKMVFSVTVDNASSNDVALNVFRKKVVSWGTSICKGQYLHMRCIAHILNLVVNDGLKDLSESIRKVRECVRYIRNSPQRIKKFMEYASLIGIESKKSLCLDVPTRWNSTYLMIEVACVYERAFEKFEEEESSFRNDLSGNIPDCFDWMMLKKFAACLAHFYMLTLRISGSLYVTSNMHFQEICDLNEVLTDMAGSEDFELKRMGQNMRNKFEKYWGDPEKMNKLIFFASVFDPSCKFEYMEFSLNSMFGSDKGDGLFHAIKRELNFLFAEYKILYDPSSTSHSHSSSESQSVAVVGPLSEVLSKPISLVKAKFKKHRMEMGNSSSKKSELEIYLSEEILEEENIDVLKWWKLNAVRFPTLSKMARDILVIPISTVASESAFSSGGRVLDSFRSSLTHKLVEALICTADWFRASDRPLIVEESLEELEKFEKGGVTLNSYLYFSFQISMCCYLLSDYDLITRFASCVSL